MKNNKRLQIALATLKSPAARKTLKRAYATMRDENPHIFWNHSDLGYVEIVGDTFELQIHDKSRP